MIPLTEKNNVYRVSCEYIYSGFGSNIQAIYLFFSTGPVLRLQIMCHLNTRTGHIKLVKKDLRSLFKKRLKEKNGG